MKIMKINLEYIGMKYFGLSCLALSLLASCDSDKYLNQVPPTEVSDADIFSTPQRIEGLVNGMYAGIKRDNFYGGRLLMFTDVRGEDFINTTANSFTGFDAWNHSYNSGSNDINNVWNIGYNTINRANVLIQGLADNPGVLEEATAANYIGEAKFIRALCYFSLVTLYAQPYAIDGGNNPGLPLRLQAETDMENNGLSRSSVAEVYQQILTDLDEAENSLPEHYGGSGGSLMNTTRAHKNTAIALKTRVYLNQGNWAKVAEESRKIVGQTAAPFSSPSGVNHQLQSDIVALFSSNFTTSESILSMPFTPQDNFSGQSALGYIYDGNQEYFINGAGVLGNAQWGANDRRRNFLRHAGGRDYLNKFGTSAPFLRYLPVIRYAEVLLNYAEAAAELGDLALANELLKAVHLRSDDASALPANVSSSKEALLAAIAIERRIEFLGEGLRSNDITRKAQAFPQKVGPSFSTNAVAPSATNYTWPIPNNELINNTEL